MGENLDVRDEIIMVRRIGQLAGALAFALVILRLNRLLQSGLEFPRWQLILVASAVLGGVVWWLLQQLITNKWVAVGILSLAGLVLFLRIAVPETLSAGFLPSDETRAVLAVEMEQAIRLIRSGIPPIVPIDGVIAILAVVMWAIGALYTWGLSGGPIASMVLPSMILYLQFAVFDRAPAGWTWMTFSAAMIGLAVVALGLERSRETGRARDSEGRPLPRRSPFVALVMAGVIGLAAILTATSASGLVSEYGNVPWRSGGSGYGLGSGGVSFDRFVDLQQKLISRNNTLLFQARLGEGAPPASQVYWRMETLDVFDGVGWKRSGTSVRQYETGRPIGDPAHRYQGSTVGVLHQVRIATLRGQIAPTAGVADEIHAIESEGAIDPSAFSAGQDSALIYQPGLFEGDRYQLNASYSMSNADLGALATDSTGNLSAIFAAAADAGVFAASAEAIDREVTEPDDLSFFTELPDNIPGDIRGIARSRTFGAGTDFERAWMLENWFRDTTQFTYDTTVSTGHSSLVLADWLTDPTSRNYRTGYCEQFATSMAVLGRSLGIPSRVVWGFTPGTTIDVDGAEMVEVRDTNAHAWVEMWMDGFGWVRFDPTPRGDFVQPTAAFDPTEFIPEIELEPPPATDFAPGGPGFFEPLFETGPTVVPTSRWWVWIIPGLALLILTVPAIKALRRRSRLKLIREGDIAPAWDEIVDRLTDLGEPVSPAQTPMELARTTDPALLSLAVGYSAAVYGGHDGQASESDLLEVEGWLHERFDGVERARAALTPRSLLKRE